MMSGREERLAGEVNATLSGCPSAAELQALHAGSLPADARPSLEAHLEGCSACRAALEPLAAWSGPDAISEETVPAEVLDRSDRLIAAVRNSGSASSRPGWGDGVLRLAAGIALVTALGVSGWILWGDGTPDTDLGELRGGEPLELLEPVGLVAAAPTAMRWTTSPGASGYRVVLLDPRLEEVWQRRTDGEEPLLVLDGEARAALAAGVRFSWQVFALGSRGQVLEPSPVAHFEIDADAAPR